MHNCILDTPQLDDAQCWRRQKMNCTAWCKGSDAQYKSWKSNIRRCAAIKMCTSACPRLQCARCGWCYPSLQCIIVKYRLCNVQSHMCDTRIMLSFPSTLLRLDRSSSCTVDAQVDTRVDAQVVAQVDAQVDAQLVATRRCTRRCTSRCTCRCTSSCTSRCTSSCTSSCTSRCTSSCTLVPAYHRCLPWQGTALHIRERVWIKCLNNSLGAPPLIKSISSVFV